MYAYIPNKLSNLPREARLKGNTSYEFLKINSERNDYSMRWNRFSTHVDARTPMTFIEHSGKNILCI